MCLIVDNCTAPRVFQKEGASDPDFGPVHKALFGTKAQTRIVIGGKLTQEYMGTNRKPNAVWYLVLQLEKAGRVRRVDESKVKSETEELDKKKLCKSNDSHIIALARVGDVHLLCTLDNALISDFKNVKLINNPPGKVYRSAKNEKLIRQPCRTCDTPCRK